MLTGCMRRAKPFAPALSSVSEASTEASSSISTDAGQPMLSPFGTWAAQQQLSSRQDDDGSSVDSLSRQGSKSAPTSPRAATTPKSPASPQQASSRTSPEGGTHPSPASPQHAQQDRSYAQVVAEGEQSAAPIKQSAAPSSNEGAEARGGRGRETIRQSGDSASPREDGKQGESVLTGLLASAMAALPLPSSARASSPQRARSPDAALRRLANALVDNKAGPEILATALKVLDETLMDIHMQNATSSCQWL